MGLCLKFLASIVVVSYVYLALTYCMFFSEMRGVKDDDDWKMVQKKGNQFVVNDKPFYVNGFNTYWLMVFAADESTRGKVTEVFKQASSVGMTVCRTWAFNDGQWRALQKSPSVYDEEVFKVLFFTVCYSVQCSILNWYSVYCIK